MELCEVQSPCLSPTALVRSRAAIGFELDSRDISQIPIFGLPCHLSRATVMGKELGLLTLWGLSQAEGTDLSRWWLGVHQKSHLPTEVMLPSHPRQTECAHVCVSGGWCVEGLWIYR